jgi:hypothetical protein
MPTTTWNDAGGTLGWDDSGGWDNGAPDTGWDAIIPSGIATPIAGPAAPITLLSLTIGTGHEALPSLVNVTIENGTIAMESGTYDGAYSGTVAGTFNGTSINGGAGTLTTGVFNDAANNNAAVSTATFNDSSTNSQTVTTATFNDSATNQTGAAVVTGSFNATSSNADGATVDFLYANADTVNLFGIAGELILVGTLSGSKLSTTRTAGAMGTFTTLSLTGVPAATGGGGGPLGGPAIEF